MREAGRVTARKRVQAAGELLVGGSNKQTLAKFDESGGPAAYATWRQQILMLTLAVGADFVAALCTKSRLKAAGEEDDEEATIDDNEGVHTPGLTMPQIRQSALLALIRGALTEGGESMALTRGCRHAGGYIMEGGHAHPQAMVVVQKSDMNYSFSFVCNFPDN